MLVSYDFRRIGGGEGEPVVIQYIGGGGDDEPQPWDWQAAAFAIVLCTVTIAFMGYGVTLLLDAMLGPLSWQIDIGALVGFPVLGAMIGGAMEWWTTR